MRLRRARALTVGILLVALLAAGCEWNFETLDGQSNGPNGRTTDSVGIDNVALVINGRPHVFYHDATAETLRHGYWNGQFWSFRIVDGAGGPPGSTTNRVGINTAAVLYNGVPHLFYYDASLGRLRHAYLSGFTWLYETLDGAGGGNGRTSNNVGLYNEVILYNGRPHVFYYDTAGRDLRHAYYNGVAWAFETLDGNGGANGRVFEDVGLYNAALLYNGRPHVFYSNATTGHLRHGYWNGVAWAFETLDGDGGPNGRLFSDLGDWNAAVLYNGRPHIFYYDVTGGDLRHAYYNGQFWAFETLDGNGGPNGRTNGAVGQDTSALLYGGKPSVFYSDASDRTLRRAHFNGTAWVMQVLDGDGGSNGRTLNGVGWYTAPVVASGTLHVFYRDYDFDDLRHGWFG